ncbi:MAG: ABC transporter permease [Aminobacterium sp.]|jgi:peptide/nickel transport system permease protein|uniref:Glutathione transport system permease protein GsiC n=1 Tax=bioreactor metagenome TaxID=1076179 RepID=A0A645B0G4_9ZZZZ|nr:MULTISPECIES: ABC transporter permease [unclassified Aminobacterium]MDD2207294.1 ABC transporter permease [Aminobacterium sp.]MDD3426635.1 ABC transporter permease [Aminobacterium sp.]MDD3707413.1 ABC transporter permease [Aminobacterium sp.]MDD4229037.1 ABC transporter permease [Aminobacterium sp.]MDD4551680.1 ABC transporter permease [Aminobacterium sp.]
MGKIIFFARTYFFRMVIVALGVSTLCFLAVEFAPGDRALDVAMARYGLDGATASAVEYVRTSEGLEKHPFIRYKAWLFSVIQGRWGHSLVGGEEIFPMLLRSFKRTTLLAGFSLLLSFLFAFPLGIYCGRHPGHYVDILSSLASSVLVSFPSFVRGAFLILLLAVNFHFFPVAGFSSFSHMVLPAITLAIGLAATSSRVIASSIQQACQTEHYKFAQHKGLCGKNLFFPHGLLNASVPIVTYVGLQAAGLLDGVVVIETLFAWPGLGSLLLDALRSGDILVIQGAGLLLGWIYVTVNTLTDWLSEGFIL